MKRKWEDHLSMQPTKICRTRHGEALVWRNDPGSWFVSVSGIGATQEDAQKLAEALLDVVNKDRP